VSTTMPLPTHPDLMPDELPHWVQRLVDDQVPEGLLLDYKGQRYNLRRDEEKSELAKDVTSFANKQGGVILLGIPERLDEQGRKTKLPDPDYGTTQEPDYGPRVRDILASVVSPMLPSLRVAWVEKAADAGKGVYLIWHPESWLSPHMVHGYGEFRYFQRDGDRSRPVPMDEQQVERLYQLRVSGEERREAFLSSDFSLGRQHPEVPHITVCLCPRMLLSRVWDFREGPLRDWITTHIFAVRRETAEWRPTSNGACSVHETRGTRVARVVQLHTNGAISASQGLTSPEDEPGRIYFGRIVRLLYATYRYIGDLYSALNQTYIELCVRVRLEKVGKYHLAVQTTEQCVSPYTPTHDGPHVLDDTLMVAEIVADIGRAVKPVLDGIWQTFNMDWQVPDEVVQAQLPGGS